MSGGAKPKGDMHSNPEGWAGAWRTLERDAADPCRYQPPESFDRLFTAEERAFILSGWGGVHWTEAAPKA
jgi:hypothetical protein